MHLKKSSAREAVGDTVIGFSVLAGAVFLLATGGYIGIMAGMKIHSRGKNGRRVARLATGILIAASSSLYFMVAGTWFHWAEKSVFIDQTCYARNPDGSRGEKIAC